MHKVTGHAADRFGFEKKGVIAAGMDADLLLFSPENVQMCIRDSHYPSYFPPKFSTIVMSKFPCIHIFH